MSPGTVGSASKDVVSAYCQAGVDGGLSPFAPRVAADFRDTSPTYIPWGATHFGADYFCRRALVGLHKTFDSTRFHYESFVVTGQPYTVTVSEHWTVHDSEVRAPCSAVHGSAGKLLGTALTVPSGNQVRRQRVSATT